MMKTTLIDLMRHGLPAEQGIYLGQTDVALSATGSAVADEVLQQNPGWELVVSSPLKRCLESAEKIAQRDSLKLLVIPELQEYDFGRWDGCKFETVYQQEPDLADAFWKDPAHSPAPEGESLDEFRSRVQRGITKLTRRSEKRILVVTHGGVIKAVIAEYLAIPPEYWGRMKLDYCHFTQLRFDCEGDQCWPQLVRNNCTVPG